MAAYLFESLSQRKIHLLDISSVESSNYPNYLNILQLQKELRFKQSTNSN